jgi:hypothetical protein
LDKLVRERLTKIIEVNNGNSDDEENAGQDEEQKENEWVELMTSEYPAEEEEEDMKMIDWEFAYNEIL